MAFQFAAGRPRNGVAIARGHALVQTFSPPLDRGPEDVIPKWRRNAVIAFDPRMMVAKVPDAQPTEKAVGFGLAEMRDVMGRRVEEIARERAEGRPGADCRPRKPIGRRGQKNNHESE